MIYMVYMAYIGYIYLAHNFPHIYIYIYIYIYIWHVICNTMGIKCCHNIILYF